MNDGACAVSSPRAKEANALGIPPLAKIVAWAVVGVDPEITGYAPVVAIPAALKKAGLAQRHRAVRSQ